MKMKIIQIGLQKISDLSDTNSMTREANAPASRDQRPTVRIQPLSNQELSQEYQELWKRQRPTQDDLDLSQEEDIERPATD